MVTESFYRHEKPDESRDATSKAIVACCSDKLPDVVNPDADEPPKVECDGGGSDDICGHSWEKVGLSRKNQYAKRGLGSF